MRKIKTVDLQHSHPRKNCGIFFAKNEITSLRWISKVKLVLLTNKNYIKLNFHSCSTNSIIFNNLRINLHDLRELLFESLSQTIPNGNS